MSQENLFRTALHKKPDDAVYNYKRAIISETIIETYECDQRFQTVIIHDAKDTIEVIIETPSEVDRCIGNHTYGDGSDDRYPFPVAEYIRTETRRHRSRVLKLNREKS